MLQGALALRERLVALVAVAVLPVAALSLWVAFRQNQASEELLLAQLRFAASALASSEERAIDAAGQLLRALAAIPGLESENGQRCQDYFRAGQFSAYTDVGFLAPDGRVVCHARTGEPEVALAGSALLRTALQERHFAMGAPQEGQASGSRVVPFVLPVVRGGQVRGVLFATIDFARTVTARPVPLPPGARVVLADRQGRIVAAVPEGAAPGGSALDVSASTRPIGDAGIVVRVGLARDVVDGAAAARLHEALGVFALTLLAALGAAWWVGGRMILAPTLEILGAVRNMARGRMDVRLPSAPQAPRNEFARIAAAFNLLADSLVVRERALQTELGRSRAAYGLLEQVLNSMHEGLIAVTPSGGLLLCNNAARKLLPLDGAPAGEPGWLAGLGFLDMEGAAPMLLEALPMMRAARGERGAEALALIRNAQVPEGRLVQCSWEPIRGEEGLVGGLVVFVDITELRRLQVEQSRHTRKVEAAQHKLVEALRIGRMGHWEEDLVTGKLWWSDEVYDLFGVRRGEFDFSLASFLGMVHPDDRKLVAPAGDRAIYQGRRLEVEYRVFRPDGSMAWMQERARARLDARGVPVWLGGIVQDITQAKLHEQALRDSERAMHEFSAMLQRATEAAQAITAQSTLDGVLAVVTEQARHVLAAREARVALASAETPPLDGDHVLVAPIAGSDGQRIGSLQVTSRTSAGFNRRDHYVALEIAQVAATAIENARLFAEVRELNATLEQRIATRTAELQKQERVFRALAEQAPEVVWNTDVAGAVIFLSRAWYELTGCTPEESLGYGWLARIHPDDLDEVRARWEQSLQSLEPYSGSRRILARDGTYHTMSYRATPAVDEAGAVLSWVGIDADVTHLKAIEEALRASNRELEAFSYSVSHDLRSPLGAIGGFSLALADRLRGHDDEKVHHYLARIGAGVERMESLIGAMLSLARATSAPLEWLPVDLSLLAAEAIDALRTSAPERRVSTRVEEGLRAWGDAGLLRTVMENLVGNAWKFTAATREAVIEVGRDAESGALFVRDNGAGFDMAYADQLFNAFRRLHRDSEFPGTGIGLATVRRIVTRHQGRVWAESSPGAGAAFYFVLPGAAPPAWLSLAA